MLNQFQNSKRIDCHFHILGDGSSGSGCWIRLSTLRKLKARYMVSQMQLPQSVLAGGLDQLYAARAREMIASSSLDAAMILAHEEPYDDSGRRITGVNSFYTPNDYVLTLAKNTPEFIPAVSIHPARRDALEELDRSIALGALMMKCLPNCQNINCSDPRFTPFWQKMADSGTILLAHTGGELSIPVLKPEYANPEILRLPLECGVTVIAAHAATNSFLDPNYLETFAAMLKRHPNLYGDISALNTPFRSRHFRRCLDSEVMPRLVYGSDIPIPVSGLWAALRGLISWRAYREIEKNTNLLERDCLIKRAMGFPEDVFIRLSTMLRTNDAGTSQ